MEQLAKKYKDQVEFLFVYCREAHAADSPQRNNTRTRDGKSIQQARTVEERKATAQVFCEDMKLSRRILIDEFGEKSAQRLYGGLNNPTVVIGLDGKVALKMPWTNGETLGRYLEPFLAKGGVTDLALARQFPPSGPGGGRQPGGPAGAQRGEPLEQMIARMLETIPMSAEEAKAVASLFRTKMQHRGRLRNQAMALEDLARNQTASAEELAQALKSFEKALADYRKAAEELDAKLSEQVSPRTRALLLGAGVLDNGFGFMGPGMMRPAGPPR